MSAAWRRALAATGLLGFALAAMPAGAAEFSLFLKCEGRMLARGKSLPGHVDLAFRDNNETVLIQRSDVLPVGERLKYKASPMLYTVAYPIPRARTGVMYESWHGRVLAWYPDFGQVSMVRMSIDRQSGALDGVLENVRGDSLGQLKMNCAPYSEEQMPAPRF